MRKAACLVVTVALFLGGGAAYGGDLEDLGENCRKLNVILVEESTDLDPEDYDFLAAYFGVAPFEWCWSQQVIGTLQGTWVLCGSFIDLYLPDPLDLGIGPDLYGNPGIIYTRKGNIYTMSYGLSVWEGDVFVAFGGLTRYMGDTGAYEGAEGWGTDSPKKYPASYWMQGHGFLCWSD